MTTSRSSRGRRPAASKSWKQLPDVDLVLAPVSGGGLLSGVAAAVKQLKPPRKVFGVEPELAGDTAESFRTGKIVEWPAELTSRTIADGLRTQSVGVRNFAHIQAFVDGIITVTEAEIRAAMRAIVRCHAPGSRAQRRRGCRRAALPRGRVARVSQGSGRRQRRQCRARAAGPGAY